MFRCRLFLGMILLIFCITLPEAEGADWKLYSENSDFRFLYEVEGMVRPSMGIVQVWIMTSCVTGKARDHLQAWGEKGGVNGYENIESSMDLYEINCLKKKFKTLSALFYDGEQNLLHSSKEESELKDIEPYSNIEALYQTVCENTVQDQ